MILWIWACCLKQSSLSWIMRYKRLIEVYMCNWKFAAATPALRHVRQFLGFSATIGHCNVGQVAMAEGFGGASGANQEALLKVCVDEFGWLVSCLYWCFYLMFNTPVRHVEHFSWSFKWCCLPPRVWGSCRCESTNSTAMLCWRPAHGTNKVPFWWGWPMFSWNRTVGPLFDGKVFFRKSGATGRVVAATSIFRTKCLSPLELL